MITDLAYEVDLSGVNAPNMLALNCHRIANKPWQISNFGNQVCKKLRERRKMCHFKHKKWPTNFMIDG